jgi:hypothetical protein
MGAEDRAPPDGDDWFKQAKDRWERQKAEDKARADDDGQPPSEPASLDPPPPEAPLPLAHKIAQASKQEHTNIEADLREMAATEAAAKKSREESLAPTMIALPSEPFDMPRVKRRQWWAAGAVGAAAAVLMALVFWPRAKPKPPAPPVVAAAPKAADPRAPKTVEAPPKAPAPPPPAPEPPAAKVVAKKSAKHKSSSHKVKHHAKKSRKKT